MVPEPYQPPRPYIEHPILKKGTFKSCWWKGYIMMNLLKMAVGRGIRSTSSKRSSRIQRSMMNFYTTGKGIFRIRTKTVGWYLKGSTTDGMTSANNRKRGGRSLKAASPNIPDGPKGSFWTDTPLRHRLQSNSSKTQNNKTSWRYGSNTWFTNTISTVKDTNGTNVARSGTMYSRRSS